MKRDKIKNARVYQKLMSVKCRVMKGVADTGPSYAEVLKQQVGSASMLRNDIREKCGAIMKRIGIIQNMTVKEKYDAAFATFLLTPEEIADKEKKMTVELQKYSKNMEKTKNAFEQSLKKAEVQKIDISFSKSNRESKKRGEAE